MRKTSYKSVFFLFLSGILLSFQPAKQGPDFYQLKIYHLKSAEQLQKIDNYLEHTYLPALHRAGIKHVGVFKPITNDTAVLKDVYVLITFNSAADWLALDKKFLKDNAYNSAAKSFIAAAAEDRPYERYESILLEAFSGQPNLFLPKAKSAERIYELRSYESPTENLHLKKMAMFNTGGEIPLFNRLGFNPVFYGKVLSGSHMPNFMYMPIFENRKERDAQWTRFGDDPQWKDISTRPENENKVSVSRIESVLMHATGYSDY
jgi:hypothetical protein